MTALRILMIASLTMSACAAPPPEQAIVACAPYPVEQILTQHCTPVDVGSSCDRCVSARCCDTKAACDRCGACGDGMVQCTGECGRGDPNLFSQCVDRCFRIYEVGLSTWAPHFACAFVRCARGSECGGGTDLDPCTQCIVDKCGVETSRYYGSIEGARLDQCFTRCRNTDCVADCRYRFLAGDPLFRDWVTCWINRCTPQCGIDAMLDVGTKVRRWMGTMPTR